MSSIVHRVLRHPFTHSFIACLAMVLWFTLTAPPTVNNTALKTQSALANTETAPIPVYRSTLMQISTYPLLVERYVRTTPMRNWTLLNRVGAVVESIPVEEGDQVRKGDILLTLSSADLISEKTALKRALEDAQSEFNALSHLGTKGATSRRSIEQAAQSLARVKAQWDQFNEQLTHYQITAPADGYIHRINTEQGTYISANTSVIEMSDINRLKTVVALPEYYLQWLKPGQEATFQHQTGEIPFRLSRIHQQSHEGAPLFDIEFTSDSNPAGISGQSGTLSLPYHHISGIHISPFALVMHQGELGIKYIDATTRTVQFQPTRVMQTFEDNSVLIELPQPAGTSLEVITLGAEELSPGLSLHQGAETAA